MRYKHMPAAEPRSDDDPVFLTAITKLVDAGAKPRRPPKNDSQIKVTEDLNYYPTTGRIVPDGKRSLYISGIDALIGYLRENGLLSVSDRP